jgi:hypothetical protein
LFRRIWDFKTCFSQTGGFVRLMKFHFCGNNVVFYL